MRPWTPLENNSTIVASTQEVSNALKMSTNATKVWVADRMCKHVDQRASHHVLHPSGNRPGSGATAGRLQGAILKWTICSNTLKQHDAKGLVGGCLERSGLRF